MTTEHRGLSFKPSDVALHVPPLVDTMGKAEREFAAALMVRVCQARGDTWAPVKWADVIIVIREDVAAKREPFASLAANPFFRPDVDALAAAGYAALSTGEDGGKVAAFTVKGLRAIMAWVPLAPGMVP